MSRLPIRLRLTAAFALAMTLVLVGTAFFLHARLRSDLDESIDAGLRTRAAGVAALQLRSPATLRETGAGALGDAEESFAQLYDARGRLVDATGGAGRAALTEAEARRIAAGGERTLERAVAGVEGVSRILAKPVSGRAGARAMAVGRSLDDRDEALSGLVASFAIGGPVAVLLAAGIGWWLAGFGLRPVEAMRARAEQVSLRQGGERLPLPAAHDEIRRLGMTLNDMLERLEGSLERERRFVADAGHELRTPLAVQKTELEGALRRGGHDPDVQAALLAALAEADHMAQLSDDLLLVARAGDVGLELRRADVDVGELLTRAAERFSDRARAEGRAIEVDAPAGLRASLDPLRVRQALGNLTDNALRHGSGTVTLVARDGGGALVLEVRDEGEGLPPELAERAFERFARGDGARTRGGTGLGLAIVAAIAQAHGGAAELDGGYPTTLRLTLPATEPAHRDLIRQA